MTRALGTALAVALLVGAMLPAPRTPAGRLARITAYTQSGITASGEPTIAGYTAACSYDLSLYSTVTMPNGDQYVCTDRGALGDGSAGYSWVDVFTWGDWRWVPAVYGDWGEIEVSP